MASEEEVTAEAADSGVGGAVLLRSRGLGLCIGDGIERLGGAGGSTAEGPKAAPHPLNAAEPAPIGGGDRSADAKSRGGLHAPRHGSGRGGETEEEGGGGDDARLLRGVGERGRPVAARRA